MRIYWTAAKQPSAKDANARGLVMASNSGSAGFKPVKWNEVHEHLYREWSPLFDSFRRAA